MQFEFSAATKIIFGSGKLNSITDFANRFGKNALILSGAPEEFLNDLHKKLFSKGFLFSTIKVTSEPTINVIQNTVDFARETKPNFLIGIGGGSALDTAKATAAMLTNPGKITDYLEVVGLNKPFTRPSIPVIAIPTTAGTGSEVTKNAVLSIPAHKIKVSLRGDILFPQIALVDPALTLSLPPQLTITTGLDALTQLLESFTCANPNPITDPFCIEGIKYIARSLIAAFETGNSLVARENMSMASLLSGLALTNAKLGVVHGLAGAIGGLIDAPHGAICANLLSNAISINISALVSRSPDHPVLMRYTQIGRLLCQDPEATAIDAIIWIQDICRKADIQPLSSFGLTEHHFDEIIETSRNSSSIKGNPIILLDNELRTILQISL